MHRVFFPEKQDFSQREEREKETLSIDATTNAFLFLFLSRTHSRSAPFSLPFSLYRHMLHALINLAIVLVDTR